MESMPSNMAHFLIYYKSSIHPECRHEAKNLLAAVASSVGGYICARAFATANF